MPIAVTYPGVYIEELPSGNRTATAVATNIAAFVGRAPIGATDLPVTIFNYGDFQRAFGGLQFDCPMSYAVQDFFANGGSQAIIARLFETGDGDGFARLAFPPSPPPLPDGWQMNAGVAAGATTIPVAPPTGGAEGEPDVGMRVAFGGDRKMSYLVTGYTPADLAKKQLAAITIVPALAQPYRKCTSLTFAYGPDPQGWSVVAASGNKVTLGGGSGLPELGDTVAFAGDPTLYPIIAEPVVTGTDPASLQLSLVLAGKPGGVSGKVTIATPLALPMPDGWEIDVFTPDAKTPSQGTLTLINGTIAPRIGDQFTLGTDPEAYVVTGFKPADAKNPATLGFASLAGQALVADDFCFCCAPVFVRQPPEGVSIKAGAKAGQTSMTVGPPAMGTIDIGDTFVIGDGPVVYTVRYRDDTGSIWFLPEAAQDIASTDSITFYPTLALRAANPGEWGNLLMAAADTQGITAATAAQFKQQYDIDQVDLFNLSLTLFDASGRISQTERYLNLAVKTTGKAANFPNRIDWVLANDSALARVDRMSGLPPASGATAKGAGGNDGTWLTPETYLGDQSLRTGIYLLDHADLFNLLCIPPDRRILPDIPEALQDLDPLVREAAAKYCTDRRAFFIVDPPVQWKNRMKQGQIDQISPEDLGIGGPSLEGRNAAVYFPRLVKEDLLMNGKTALFAPCGAVAGVMASTDVLRGVWKAPAGQDATLANVAALEVNLNDADNGVLNPKGINCLRNFPLVGPVVWGARTLRGADQFADDYKYISVRRLTLFIEESLYRSTQWAVFEPNNEALWSSLRLCCGSFLADLARQGAFYTYSVACDATTTTPDDIRAGRVNVLIRIAPVLPAEFVVLQIQQIAGGPAT
jgi:hypothetical protein